MWGGLRRAKKQITHILQQSRTSRELYTIRTSLQSLWEIGRTLNTTVKNCCPSGLFFFPSEGKKNWLALSTGILKNALHKLITEKNLLPLRVKNNKALRDNVCFLRVLDNLHSSFYCFFTVKIVVLQGLVQGIMRPWALWSSIIGFMPWSASLLVGYWLVLGSGFEESIWIVMGSALWILPVSARDFAHNISWR